jgi:hypothetical protein
VTVSIATPAPAVMDLTLPLGFGAGTPIAATASNVYDASSGSGTLVDTASSDLITVSLDQPATAQFPGAVSVSVPERIVASGQGFSFPLPAALAAAAAGGSVQVSLQDGGPLPSWLLYVPGSRTFIAAATMPAGALPVQTVVRIGDQRWTLSIIERMSR